MEKVIEQKLDELRLQMNYLCYDKEILEKFSGVWKAFYELEESLINESDSKQPTTNSQEAEIDE